MRPVVVRPNLARSLDRALLVILCSGLGLVGVQTALLPWRDAGGGVLLLFPAVCLAYLGAGLRAWYRRPSNRLGAVILFGGLAVWIGSLQATGVPGLVAVGTVGATLILAVLVHLLLAFPSGRLIGPVPVATVAAAYVTSLVLQAPKYVFDPTVRAQVLFLADDPTARALGMGFQQLVGAGVMVSTAAVLIGRLVRTDAAGRRVLAPLFTYGVGAALFIPVSSLVLTPVFGLSAEGRAAWQLLVLGGVPFVFVFGMLRGGFARTGELEELGAWLSASDGSRPALTRALSRALGDPSLALSFWVARQRIFVDDRGVPIVPDTGPARGFVPIELDGRTVGAVHYDSQLIADPELVRTAGQVIAIAVDRERLTAELRESQRALQFSRERLVDAGDRERRRIAQDLHDGLQVQLVLLALEAQQLANAAGTDTASGGRATQLRQRIDAAAADLRQLVAAVMPAALVEHGLGAAVEDLADRMPIPTTLVLSIGEISPSSALESTAYFVTAEALTNTVKHAQASRASVRLISDDGWLRIEVSDDGVGGANPGRGRGLRGMTDRIDVLGGRLTIASEPGQGTRIEVALPCG
ncbi:sensor histidine kinase [Raineyella sp. LH-20]|uniref:sensor histidine kinase n=1 Tax=Raineyella sp. LH-20 TaxID=3081204 RepID=UPI002952BFBD|nr:sensor histidine kinase [Raineyella sp. LH-20]WOP18659.1 sensor histidine kinase [Raineyella sp. LH-20]